MIRTGVVNLTLYAFVVILPLYALSLIFPYRSYIGNLAKGIGDYIDLGGMAVLRCCGFGLRPKARCVGPGDADTGGNKH
jgi:hypothetical protein